ncbi:MAG: ABC transporter substrate-binding protein [Desulfobacterales bacterium]|nr:ABC transporter substrate-binding protein [Desulfobacterales bacterium]
MKSLRSLLALFFVCIFLGNVSVWAADKGNFSTSPLTKNGKKWRIGYYEGGDYIDYHDLFIATIKGLMELGWIEKADIPYQKEEQTKSIWKWLATQSKSKYLQFVEDAHYNSNWDKNIRKKTKDIIINRLNNKKDIDLMIAMGTWAGQDLANDRHKTPTMAISCSDALGAGIIKSIEDSGYDHISAWVDPFRFKRQVKIFHDIIRFKKLGITYENTKIGRSYGGIGQVEEIAKEHGFELVTCYSKSNVSDAKIAEESVIKCFNDLAAKKVDAIYATMQLGISTDNIPKLVNIANSNKIPTFTQSGSEQVRYGFLMSLSQAEFRYLGKYHAETFTKVFNGAKPRQLEQIFEEPTKIAINLESAKIIGYDPSMDVLGIVDEPYEKIEKPGKKK